MCGICGFIGTPDHDKLLAMRDAMTHRGPDAAGVFQDERVSLGHRRLSIVDLHLGQQPMSSPDGSLVVVFNGEIYNHPALKAEFVKSGVGYRTNSDTETLLHTYVAHGESCVQHLQGMFAFVIYDRRRKVLFGARDRFGKKPFFYTFESGMGPDSFSFASEIKGLLPRGIVQPSARMEGIIDFLSRDYSATSGTCYHEIYRLPAGHAFRLDLEKQGADALTIWPYWQNPISSPPLKEEKEEDALAKCHELFSAAVGRRLMSDVPLGVFLSGGIDSSAIVAYLAQSIPARDIQTFSIGFDDPSFDESAYAKAVADHFGTTHRMKMFTAQECLTRLQATLRHFDEPFADPSALPTSMLCEFTREHVTVALGGDGGDELFAGYDPIGALKSAKIYHRWVPDVLHRFVFLPAAGLLPASSDNLSLGFKAKRFLTGAAAPESIRLPTWMGAFNFSQLSCLLPDYFPNPALSSFDEEQRLFDRLTAAGADEVQQASAYYQHFYLTDDIMVKADQMSMRHSLEVRAPFLDTWFAEYVNALPSHFKYRNGQRKYLLKRLLGGGTDKAPRLPDRILYRKKKGFGMPVSRWIRNELTNSFRKRLVDNWPSQLSMFNTQYISRLLDAHVKGSENNYKELWALYVLTEWVESRNVKIV